MIGQFLGLLLLTAPQNAPAVDPYLLAIGPPGRVRVENGLTDLRSGQKATAAEVARAARGASFVLVGESHETPAHHQVQADIIRALVQDGRHVTVGFEMFTRPNQENLNPWTLGWWSEAEFVERAQWKTQWGYDFAAYRPVFEAIREFRLPMLALNVPRDWVRQVGRQGPAGLTPEQQAQVPALYLENTQHKTVFESLLGGHPLAGDQGRNMYAAMVLWDEGMADTALKYQAASPNNPQRVIVMLAGIGHALYKQGIDWRIQRRTGQKTVTVISIESDGPREVSRGLGDFVFSSKPIERAPRGR
ncbi:MAG TPA: ChaN family lipoprotein [Fimbriimonadaceae bacterium]|nr:ChaN family lipoprotein [Fimbriimonadaceae bacterium]HRJ32562.1 ChaN family lipoprotein [Fimbriimonadaceae bacterium]